MVLPVGMGPGAAACGGGVRYCFAFCGVGDKEVLVLCAGMHNS